MTMDELQMDDVAKLKVAELKKELAARGLSVDGKKAELCERLKEHLDSSGSQSAHMSPEEEAALLGLEDEVKETPSEEKTKVVTEKQISTEASEKGKTVAVTTLTDADRVRLRAEKFGPQVTHGPSTLKLDSHDRKLARVERFGSLVSNGKDKPLPPAETTKDSGDKLRKRLERFGGCVSKDKGSIKLEKVSSVDRILKGATDKPDKLQDRALRFGSAVTATTTTNVTKLSSRAKRFGIV